MNCNTIQKHLYNNKELFIFYFCSPKMRNGIDESLDLLKDLEAKLRIQQNHQV